MNIIRAVLIIVIVWCVIGYWIDQKCLLEEKIKKIELPRSVYIMDEEATLSVEEQERQRQSMVARYERAMGKYQGVGWFAAILLLLTLMGLPV